MVGGCIWDEGSWGALLFFSSLPPLTPSTAPPSPPPPLVPSHSSMFAIDVAVDSASATQEVVLLSAAGKAVAANKFGNGGTADGFVVTVTL